MKKIAIFILCIFILSCTPQEIKPIKIGAIMPLSGAAALYGELSRKGLDLAETEINTQGGINGRPIKLIYEDDKGLPADAVTAFNKLKDIDGIKFVVSEMSSIALAIAPLANENQILQMDASATTPDYTSVGDFSTLPVLVTRVGGLVGQRS